MRKSISFFILFGIIALMLVPCIFVYAQNPGVNPLVSTEPEVDPMGFVGIIFSPALAIMVGAIVGFTKIVRNTINLKGPLAVVVTVVVSIGYSLMQFNSEGLGVAILVGIVAALVSTVGFKLTKLFGKAVNPEGTK